jgi:hypothetical protein
MQNLSKNMNLMDIRLNMFSKEEKALMNWLIHYWMVNYLILQLFI